MSRTLTPFLIPLLALAACSGPDRAHANGHSHDGATGLSTVTVTGRTTGRVMSVGELGNFITLDHDDMPGVMGPMRMGFDVGRDVDVSMLEPGDEIEFEMEMSDARGIVLTRFCSPETGGGGCLE